MQRMKWLMFVTAFAPFAACFAGSTDFTPHGTQPGLSFPLEAPTNCHSCHKGESVTDLANTPYNTWLGSMKANATRDPLFWAALDVANNDVPGIGDFCLRCHTPQGWYNGHVVKPALPGPNLAGENGCELLGSHVAGDGKLNDYGGVNCHFCHRIDPEGPNGEAQILQNAATWVDDEQCDNNFGPCRKGPYTYDSFGFHAWEYSDFIQDSTFCASCHDVSAPEVDNGGSPQIIRTLLVNGVDTGLAMPYERTYSEWHNSRFADLIYIDGLDNGNGPDVPAIIGEQHCQSCHMPNTGDPLARACVFEAEGSRANNLPTHQFAGGNTWVPQLIKTEYGDALEANDPETGRKDALDATTAYAMDMLQMNSAIVQTTLSAQSATQLDVAVKVTNLAGHKLPTGYLEGRRMWIHVEARDASDALFFESGAYNATTGVLTEDAQIKVYEAIQGIWDGVNNVCKIDDGAGNKLFHFVLNDCIYKDNRIPPLGFRGGSDPEMAPVGITYPAHPTRPGELVNYDVANYQIPITGVSLPITVTATLKFQIASKEYIDFLDDEATDNAFPTENLMCNRSWTIGPADQSRGAFMKDLWDTNGKSAPVDMTFDSLEIQP